MHLEADWFFRSISSGYIEPWEPDSHSQNAVVMRIVARAAAGYADAGYFTIIDGIFAPRWFLKPVRDELRAAGHAIACAVLRASFATCNTRLSERGAEPLPDVAVLQRLWREFSDLGPLEDHAIDNDAVAPASTVAELLRRLRQGALAL